MTTFATRLNNLIPARGISGFAKDIGITEGAVRNYLQHGAMPGLDVAVKVADVTGVNLEWLATGRGPMRKAKAKKAPVIKQPALDASKLLEALLVSQDINLNLSATLNSVLNGNSILLKNNEVSE